MTDGLHVYLDSADLTRMAATKWTLRRCGATAAFVLMQAVDGRLVPFDRFVAVCNELRSIDVTPIGYTFPSLASDMIAARKHYLACTTGGSCRGQLDAEPLGRTYRWTPAKLAPWLSIDPAMSITTTRAQSPGLGEHRRELWLQLESQKSTATRFAEVLDDHPGAPLVTGMFDADDDPRTIDEVLADLRRCTPRARETRKHAVWSARTINDDEADALKEWAVETWQAA